MAAPRQLIYGLHAVAAALRRDPARLLEIQVAEGMGGQARLQNILKEARGIGITVHACSRKALDKLVAEGGFSMIACGMTSRWRLMWLASS